MTDNVVAEAGAIAVRLLGNNLQVLLVHANTKARQWILPKGHLERGETPAAAALRELKEEAGVVGEIVQFVGTLEFTGRAGPLRVEYFLISARSTNGLGEPNREPTWFGFDDALKIVEYEDTRRLLAKAKELYDRSLA